jgi:AAA family ATP:ADP antiporter
MTANNQSTKATSENLGPIERLLRIFTEVRAGEATTVLLLTLDVFLLLTAYYLLKTVREPLILKVEHGAEIKSYASAGQAVLLIGVVRAYAWLAKRYGRLLLLTITSLFFVANLVLFFFLGRIGVPLGVPFYLWVGCFSLTVIAQFWSFANDVYTPEQGKRLFAIVGVGSSLGSIFGAKIAGALFVPLGPYMMMLAAAGVLLLSVGLIRVVDARESARVTSEAKAREAELPADKAREAKAPEAPVGGTGGFTLIMRDRYLLMIALLSLILNWVNSTGEYVLDRTLIEGATRQIANGTAGGLDVEQIIGVFKANYFLWVNVIGAVVQLFLVSRIIKFFGLRVALMVMPVIAFGGYTTMAFFPLLSLVKAAKIAENSADYSIQNTSRQMLYLPLSREAKYNAKAAIDTVFVRGGDVMSAVVVWVGSQLAFGTRNFAMVNMVLIVAWIALVWRIGRTFQEKTRDAEAAKGREEAKGDAAPVAKEAASA